MRELLHDVESNCVNEVEEALDNYKPADSVELVKLFDDSVDAEIRFYK